MNALFLALLLSGSSMTPATPTLVSQDEGLWPYCGYNEVYKATYYYQYPGGPECGLRYQYCSKPPYTEGCTTSYYDTAYFQCSCP